MPCGLTFESRIATTGMPSTLASLIASSSLLASIDEHHVGNAAHVADAAERQLELVALAGELQDFLLGQARGVARKLLLERS